MACRLSILQNLGGLSTASVKSTENFSALTKVVHLSSPELEFGITTFADSAIWSKGLSTTPRFQSVNLAATP